MTESRAKPARADALRNRVAILDAARGQITAHGPDVGVDQIAAAAGVAVGTLYRHFPTKTDLVAAVLGRFVAQVADDADHAADRVARGRPAYEELTGLLHGIVRASATNHAVKAAAGALNADLGDPADIERARVAVRSLIIAAQADGTIREDLSVDDFYLLISNAPAGRPAAVLDRWVDLTLFGITGDRPRPRTG